MESCHTNLKFPSFAIECFIIDVAQHGSPKSPPRHLNESGAKTRFLDLDDLDDFNVKIDDL